ncbi:hypothetical protein ABW20_dc0106506 [Dactylellina cionopaga]|nr:hypothetical protein ABW20_dc0106506 [Dactylellina cionopaga]
MEEDPGYYTTLLYAFRQHRRKFCLHPTQRRAPQDTHQGKVHENLLLRNRQEFFETGFLRILSRNDLDGVDIQALPSEEEQEILTRLSDFFKLLNKISNPDFNPTASAPSRSFSQPSGRCPKLERQLSILDWCDGPFDLTSGTSSSIFVIDTLTNGRAARSVVQELNNILDDIQIAPLPSADITPNYTDAIDSWIRSFDSEYRIFVGKILDTIHAEFTGCGCGLLPPQGLGVALRACETTEPPNNPHKIMIQLLDITLLDMPNSKTDLESLLYCPRPDRWQNTRCKLNR